MTAGCTLLSGCFSDESSKAIFDNYYYRLSNSLDVDQNLIDKNLPALSLVSYPKKSELTHDIPPIKVNVLQFLQLSQCDLQRLLGKRNSSLGRLMDGYHSLLYEYEFLLLAQQCQQELDSEGDLFKALDQAVRHKQAYQQQIRWNAIFASDEFRYLFSSGTKLLTKQQLVEAPNDLVLALESIQFWLLNPVVNQDTLAQAYQVLTVRKYIGELRSTMAMAVSVLAHSNSMIEQRLSHRPLCRKAKSNPKFEVVNTVFRLYYIGEVQPALAKLHQQGKIVFTLLDKLQNVLLPTPEFIAYWHQVYQANNSEWQKFNQAILTHTKQWQRLLKQCDSLPS